MDLKAKLEAVAGWIAELIYPPVTLLEIVELAKALGEVVREYDPQGSYDQHLTQLREAWDWAETKFELVRKLDDALKLPFYLEPFDGPLFRWLVLNQILPSIARTLTKA